MFDVAKVLDEYEKKIAKWSGLRIEVDKHNFKQDIGAGGYVTFTVRPLYDIDNNLSTDETLVRFYTGLSDLVNSKHFAVGEPEFDLRLSQKFTYAQLSAEVRVPMTYTDFGDQI